MRTLLVPLLMAVATVAVAQAWADGEVRKLDRAQGRLTLRHGEIPSLKMPPMTMVYRVADRAQLDGLSEGARVRFVADKVDGQYVITRLEVVR